MAQNMPSVADVAQRWQQGFGNSGQKWAAGVQSVKVAPGQLAAAAKDRYVQGVNANADKFATNVARYTASEWAQITVSKGQGRLASGAQAGVAKYQTKMAPVLQAIGAIRDTLPARADIMTNLQRSQQLALALHERAQQGW